MRYVDNAPWSVVTNTGLAYKNNELTLGYQWDSSFAATLMVQDIGFISVGYSYQFPTAGALASIVGGNHEILLKIRLGKAGTAEVPEEPTEESENISTAN